MAQFQKTLDPKPNEKIKIDIDDPAVQTCLELIWDNYTEKNARDQINEAALQLAEDGFIVEDPKGPEYMNTLLPYQALWKTLTRIKSLDFAIHGTGADQAEEKLVTAGLETILDRSYYLRTLLSKGGVIQNGAGIGDGFWSFTTQEKGFPFKTFPIPNNNVYVDTQATGMRTGDKTVYKLAFLVQMPLGEFNRTFPKFKDKVGAGEIPRTKLFRKDVDQKLIQQLKNSPKKFVELCYYFDISNMAYVIFAGPGCTLIKKEEGDDYPYTFKDENTNREEPYIPVFHFMGMRALKGFYNHGLFHALYKPAQISQRVLNKTTLHIEDNADPVNFISVGQGQGDAVIQQIETANAIRAAGGKPVVPLERGLGDSGTIGNVSLYSPSNVSEVEYVQQQIILSAKRLGIHYDEPETAGTTATEILSEEENANMFVKQMMEDNAPEFEFFLKVVLDLVKKTVSKADKTPLNLTTSLSVVDRNTGEEVLVRPDDATLGLFVMALKEKHYFPKINARSGAIAPKLRAAQVARGLAQAAPGSKAFKELHSEYASINDLDLKGEDFLPQDGGMPQAGQSAEEGPIPASTERLTINPRLQEQIPVI